MRNNRVSDDTMIEKIKLGLSQWLHLNVLLLACMILVRWVFFFEINTRLAIELNLFHAVLVGSLYDLLLACRLICFGLVPFLLLHFFAPKAARGIYVALIVLYGVVSALLAEYYCNLNMPLDHVILVYSPEEVMGTAASSASITATPFIWFFLTVGLTVLLTVLWRRVHLDWRSSLAIVALGVLVTLLVPYKNYVRREKFYQDHSSFCLGVNQPSYSYIKITDYLRNTTHDFLNEDYSVSDEVLKAARAYQEGHPEFQFADLKYPYYRKFDDPDVLGAYLSHTDDSLPPNFVFIIVEGLGQRLTGVDYPTASFTPYIDSLKGQGLYWKNCLSTAERTFGVLPSMFASAPYGKLGFCQTWEPMPDHQSFLRDMKHHGYEISYYYGVAHTFGRFDMFLKSNKTDYIYVPDMQQVDSSTYKTLKENHRWGLDDKELFQYAIGRKTEHPSSVPYIDIYMTLTTHEPFLFDDVKAYETKAKAIMDAHSEMSDRERMNISKNLNVFACFLYLDDCVCKLITYYQTLPEYKNTIFVLTGDHRMGFLNFGGALHKYNIPLLIYSPLVARPKTMNAVVSHLDVTPTFNAYLRDNYHLVFEDYCHWLGTSLDTVSKFRNTRKQAFMLNNRDVVDYIDDTLLINNNRLYRFDKDFIVEPLDDAHLQDRMATDLANFQVISQFSFRYNHLNCPDTHLEVLKNITFDFESHSSSKFSPYIREAEGNFVVAIDSTVEYAPFFDEMELYSNYEDVFLEMSFDLQGLDRSRDLPLLVVCLGQYYMSLKLNSVNDESLNTGKWEHFRYYLSVPVQGECKGDFLKIYLFNNKKTAMCYDNIAISVKGKPSP